MAPEFRRGSTVYAKDGRSYRVDDVEGGIVYCSTPDGAETEFPEAALVSEAAWALRSDGRRDLLYARLKQARAYLAPAGKLDREAAAQMLAKLDRLSPGILDFIAFTAAERVTTENGDQAMLPQLSIAKCRGVFDGATPEVRATLVAGILGAPPEALVGAGRLGDNLMRAMLEKGMKAHEEAFESFLDRPRQ
ncbi:MAG TPA: hypothetical protein VM689_19190 [Aliidongia sp.]|nr:hypothetical protein [Aliidongia sp.]